MVRILCKVVPVLLLAASVSLAGNTGKIAGEVKDAGTGEALVGANIVIQGTTQGSATNIEGYYVILNVPPGTYTLVASAVGFNRRTISNVTVNIDYTTKIDVEMQSTVVEVGEEVVVTAQRPMIQADQTAKTAVVGGDAIQALPVTEVSQVLELQAGFVGGSLRGGRGGEVAYWIDGVPVTDVYDGSQVVEVNKDLVQELQLVSGAFNAEYGQAMSGIVNIATREGGPKFTGGISAYIGQYLTDGKADGATGKKMVFSGLDEFDPAAIHNFEANLSGPIMGEDLTFFVNGRYIYFDGWLNGYRRFNPQNISYTNDTTRQFVLYRNTEDGRGDSAETPLNDSRRWYGQAKLTWKVSPTMKLNTNYIYDNTRSTPYNDFNADNRNYFYNPGGLGDDYNVSNTVILQLSQTLSQSTFYTVGASWFQRDFNHYLYDFDYVPDPSGNGELIQVVPEGGPSYVHPDLLLTPDSYSYYTGGTDLRIFNRRTITKLLKADISSQLDRINLVKAGVEYRRHNVFYENITLQPIASQTDIDVARVASPYIQTRILPTSSNVHDVYDRRPHEFSAYIQDKLEFKNFILNIGVRFDYFEPDGYVLNDDTSNGMAHYTVDDPNIYRPIKPSNQAKTLEERRSYWYKPASSKSQFSPRIGASFPITAQGIVYFSYGHFFQVPRFERLYQNPEFKIGSGTGNQGVVGNADLNPEQTINAEIGVQQQIASDIAVDLTAYMRDVRGLTGTRSQEIVVFGGASKYSRFTNSDFGLIKGIAVTLRKQFGAGFAATVDYTYSVAKGSGSDPEAARNALAGGSLPEVQLTALDWDQRHTLNVTAAYSASNWGVSAIGQFGSGFPYTPRSTTDITSLLTNTQLEPSSTNIDLRAYYEFPLGDFRLVAFARVFNVLDIRNEEDVWNDTGRAGYTTYEEQARQTKPAEAVNTLEEWYTRPLYYSEPRRIELGLNLEF